MTTLGDDYITRRRLRITDYMVYVYIYACVESKAELAVSM
jgi:hypothetical protein